MYRTDVRSRNFSLLGRAPLSRRRLLVGSLALPLTLLGCSRRRSSGQQGVDLFIESDGDFLAFRRDELTCCTGVLVRLCFHHEGKFLSARHNWVRAYPDHMASVDKAAQETECVISRDAPRC